jgi:phospholipase C
MAMPEHVIVLALENRSFDQLLGYLPHPDPSFDGLRGPGPYANPGWDNGPPVPASPTGKSFLPVDPDHSHDAVMEQLGVKTEGDTPNNQGFVTSYERKGRGLAQPQFEGLLAPLINWWNSRKPPAKAITDRGPLIMQCQDPANVPVLSTLALQYGVCTRWFCSVPGETWPNRNFLHAATSDGETDIDPRFYDNPTIFELVEKAGKTWHIYYDDTPQVWAFSELWEEDSRRANWFEFPEFAKHVANDGLPSYSFIEPNHRPPLHTIDNEALLGGTPGAGNSQHPGNNLVSNDKYDTFVPTGPTDFTRAENLIATIYEALRTNPAVFEKTVLLVTYDEHGGFYDHVPPPTDATPVGEKKNILTDFMHLLYRRKSAKFGFTMLGPRVPAVVISPFVNAGTIDTIVRDHSAVPATVRQIFAPNEQPLTARDAAATPFTTLLNRDQPRRDDLPDLSAHAVSAAPAAPQPAGAAPAVGPAAFAAGPTPPSLTPDGPAYYQDLVQLSDMVRTQLKKKGVVDAHGADTLPPIARAAKTTDAFTASASAARPPG